MKFKVIMYDIDGEKSQLPPIECRTFEDAQNAPPVITGPPRLLHQLC